MRTVLEERFMSDLCFVLGWACGLRQVGQSDALPSLYNYHEFHSGVLSIWLYVVGVLLACMYICVSWALLVFRKARRGREILRNWSYRQVVSHHVSSGRQTWDPWETVRVLHCWAISPEPLLHHFKGLDKNRDCSHSPRVCAEGMLVPPILVFVYTGRKHCSDALLREQFEELLLKIYSCFVRF